MSPRNMVLAFHKLSPRLSYGVTNFSPGRFEALLESVPLRDVVISFDDGYRHLLDHLPALMERRRFTPVIFIPTALIGQDNTWDYSNFLRPERHLDKAEIRRLADMGVMFGTHGHSHCDLTGLPVRELELELRRSKQTLEDITGRAIQSLSYPFGRWNRRVTEAAVEAGYTQGFTMRFPRPDDFALAQGRIAIYSYDTPLSVRHKLATRGLFYEIERLKASVTNRLSGGTIVLNRLRAKLRRRG